MKIKLGFIDTFDTLAAPFFIEKLSKRYEVVRDDQNPDIIIFGDKTFGQKNLNFDPHKVLKVFFTGENIRPNDYPRHCSIGFDHDEGWNDMNHYRMPLYALEIWQFDNLFKITPSIHDNRDWGQRYGAMHYKLEDWFMNRGFCGFVNSNPRCKERNEFFHKLSNYKKVASGGPLFNNIGRVIPRNDGVLPKVEFLSNHKFTLCYENGTHPGYVTEKLVHAFYANTIPIYWGSETVAMDFNPKAFLNWFDYRNDAAFIERIKEVDNNFELYYNMLCEPAFVTGQYNPSFDDTRFLDWWDSVPMNILSSMRVNV